MTVINAVGNALTGSTGTGTFVGSSSPTITTPTIARINDSSGNAIETFTKNGVSAVNYWDCQNNPTGYGPSFNATGSDSNINCNLIAKGTGTTTLWGGSTTALNLLNGTSNQHQTYFVISDTAASRAITIPDASGTMTLLGNASTGSGSVVLATTPTIVQPKIAQINDTNNNGTLLLTATASAVNYITLANSATTFPITFTAGGTDSNIGITFTTKGTGGVSLSGTTAADSAAAGYVGELLSSANATGVAMTTGATTQIQTLTLTAGDWDVWGVFYTTVNALTTLGVHRCMLNTSSATFASPTTAQLSATNGIYGVQTTGTQVLLNTGMSRWNVSGSTTVYLNASASYGTNTLTGNGSIYARRRR